MISILYIAVLVFVVSMVATLAGFGISTIMVPILSLFFPLPQTVFFVGIIHWIINVWKFLIARKSINWSLVLYFGIPSVISSFLAGLYVATEPIMLTRFLGVFLIIYVIFLFWHPSFRLKGAPSVAITGGGISGFLAGIIGIHGAVKSAFLSAFNLPKFTYIATSATISLCTDTSRIIAYFLGQLKLPINLLYGVVLFIPVSFLGVRCAYYFVGKIPQRHFRLVVSIFLLAVGMKLLFW